MKPITSYPYRYNCVIVDDEPSAINFLADRLNQVAGYIDVTNTYTSISDAIAGLKQINCDILFLDISIHLHNGMDLLRCVPELKCEVIFVTGHTDFSLQAFQFNTSGYLLKPVDDIELISALNRATERCKNRNMTQNTSLATNTKIGIAGNNEITFIDMDDILYLEAFNSYTRIFTKKEQILSSYSLGRYREVLPSPPFIQTHRSYIINTLLIKQYKGANAVVVGINSEVPVSKKFRNHLLDQFIIVAGHK